MPEEPLDELGPPPEGPPLLRGELLQRGCDPLDPASPRGLERAATLARRLDDPRPPVVLARDSPGEVGPLEPLHDPRHRRRTDPFSLRQLAERHRPTEATAVFSGDRESARLLLEAGADPNGEGEGGFTPLHSAAMNGNADFVRLLLSSGADAGLPLPDGRTAEHVAREGGHRECARLLASEGAHTD